MNPFQLRFDMLSTDSPDAKTTPGCPFKRIPLNMKKIFAIECSKPDATNAVTGKTMANIFPITYLEESAIHTARQTSQLHNIPLVRASENDKLTFAFAIFNEKAPIL